MDWPTVTIAVVNLDGRDLLERCLSSLQELDYPADLVETVLIDNASTDGSVEMVRDRFPSVQVIVNETNVGFAPAVNQAARAGQGEILALINNDAHADAGWLRELVRPLMLHDHVACTGGLVLNEDGERIDYAGGAAGVHGHGFPLHHGEAPTDELHTGPTLFATGSSLATRRQLFLDVGGFDDDYFAYFEDVDYGWRLWVMGYEVWFVPRSKLFHLHHGTIERFGYARERFLLERNALYTIFKNQGDELLSRSLPMSTVTTVLRALADDGTDIGDYAITGGKAEPLPEPTLTPTSAAHFAALQAFGQALPALREKRGFVQGQRAREDREVVRLLRYPVMANIADPDYVEVFDQFIETFDLLLHGTSRQRILIVCADKLGEKMAGPAIRAWEMAKLLSREHEVVLGSMTRPEIDHPAFAVEHLPPERMRERIAWAEVIVTQGVTMWWFPEMVESDAAVVVDIYDPFHVEALEVRKDMDPHERWATARSDVEVVNQQLRRGDLLLCASEKQRDFWLGMLSGVGRINPATYDADPDLRQLLDVAPFGLPDVPPVQQESGIRGAVDGIGPDDLVLLWGGGIYNWFDPVTLIRGVQQAAQDEPRLKLFFMGTAHPNPDVPEMRRAADAYREAERLGVLGEHVFFNDGWVPYERRADYLLDADIGVSTHFLHIETELSFRTRILDYLWTGLPILCTEGDSMSRLVLQHDLGEVVRAEDPDDIARALRVLIDPDRRAEAKRNVEALAPQMTWERALAPLVSFARLPVRAPDLADARGRPYIANAQWSPPRRTPVELARRFVATTQDKGLSTAIEMAQHKVKSRLNVRKGG